MSLTFLPFGTLCFSWLAFNKCKKKAVDEKISYKYYIYNNLQVSKVIKQVIKADHFPDKQDRKWINNM
jgi:hypothetical protein